MLWLAATPLRSASVQLDAQAWNWDTPETVPKPPVDGEESCLTGTRYHEVTSAPVKEPAPAIARASESSDVTVPSFHPDQPETIMEPDLRVTSEKESHSITSYPSSPESLANVSASTSASGAVSTVVDEISYSRSRDTKSIKIETSAPVGSVEVIGDSNAERDYNDDVDSWETEESSKMVSANAPSSTSDGPASFRSLSRKNDEGENSIGSLSRLAGLGRAARRQLASVLDEFWGQLYDSHGQATREAKAKKFDALLRGEIDSRCTGSLQKVDAHGKEYSEYLASVEGRADMDCHMEATGRVTWQDVSHVIT